VRADAQLGKSFWRGGLIRVHPRQPAGGRCTNPDDLPAERSVYALRDLNYLVRQAELVGASVGVYAHRLLDVELPWTRMRQVYRLLGLARRYGDRRVEAACAQALALDVVDVSVIGRLLERAREHTHLPSPPVVEQLPLRFTRHPIPLGGSNRPHPDTTPTSLRPSEAIVEAGFASDPVGERR
jgi:hypothetical protein